VTWRPRCYHSDNGIMAATLTGLNVAQASVLCRPHAGLSLSAAAKTQRHGVTKAQAVASRWPHANLGLRKAEAAWQQRPAQPFPSCFPGGFHIPRLSPCFFTSCSVPLPHLVPKRDKRPCSFTSLKPVFRAQTRAQLLCFLVPPPGDSPHTNAPAKNVLLPLLRKTHEAKRCCRVF